MPLALLVLQFAALSCAALALALPGYVFVVLVWSSLRTMGAGLAETGAAAASVQARSYVRGSKVALASDGPAAAPALT